MRLSVLDQSPMSLGGTAHQALEETARLAQWVERLGYTRFWVSEHHDTRSLAGSSPEVLLAHLGARTERIRIGSGGVMLPHYSAYKVAENFRLLEALYPRRIDLGLGRAPGGMPRSTMALREGRPREPDYLQQVQDVMYYLTDTLPEDHRFRGLTATPVTDTVPEVWLLGSSDWSAHAAAHLGTAFMFAQFINGDGGVEAVHAYRERFRPSSLWPEPVAGVAVFCVCADADAEAERIASSLDLSLLMLANGQPTAGTPTIEMALNYPYSKYERAVVLENRKRMVVGGPESVKQQLEALAKAYGVDEVMLTTRTERFEDRLRSFELVAQVFGLTG
ncbi:LLM class flavin-dependent oxidoreductase [Alicyclobacillus macrosporangiidus]|uniref:Luciferase family oxidoreductase, group 1 n=1 Tax=Alicyclobacillus macrosporangiidus TaxID=392015 RepID=A0A1I7G8K7_9BACL|nr:LLM class flavin-dependent oxidoreductase [Alicyclobacillus macrosporangiidus]SFU44795.1 luciferase family oxidoreductase, group 1 [Alicyclobacillus macrosporangiidus]